MENVFILIIMSLLVQEELQSLSNNIKRETKKKLVKYHLTLLQCSGHF